MTSGEVPSVAGERAVFPGERFNSFLSLTAPARLRGEPWYRGGRSRQGRKGSGGDPHRPLHFSREWGKVRERPHSLPRAGAAGTAGLRPLEAVAKRRGARRRAAVFTVRADGGRLAVGSGRSRVPAAARRPAAGAQRRSGSWAHSPRQ